jgi:hypothetical protein
VATARPAPFPGRRARRTRAWRSRPSNALKARCFERPALRASVPIPTLSEMLWNGMRYARFGSAHRFAGQGSRFQRKSAIGNTAPHHQPTTTPPRAPATPYDRPPGRPQRAATGQPTHPPHASTTTVQDRVRRLPPCVTNRASNAPHSGETTVAQTRPRPPRASIRHCPDNGHQRLPTSGHRAGPTTTTGAHASSPPPTTAHHTHNRAPAHQSQRTTPRAGPPTLTARPPNHPELTTDHPVHGHQPQSTHSHQP